MALNALISDLCVCNPLDSPNPIVMKKLSLLLILAIPLLCSAQNSFYFMKRLPQATDLNPANLIEAKFSVALPSVSLYASNPAFTYQQLDDFRNKLKSPDYDPNDFFSEVGTDNQFQTEMKLGFFNFQKVGRKLSYGVSSSLNSVSEISSSTTIAYALGDYKKFADGRIPFTVNNINIESNTYLTTSVFVAFKPFEKLTIAIRPNLNMHLATIRANNLTYEVKTDPLTQDTIQSFTGTFLLGPQITRDPNDWIEELDGINFDKNSYDDDEAKSKIVSFTFDFGTNYQLGKITLSASILNLGKLKAQTYEIVGQNDTVTVDINRPATFKLPSKIYLGANYQINPNWSAGILYHHSKYQFSKRRSTVLSINGEIGKVLSTTASYTFSKAFNDLGVGFRLRFLPGFDFYFASDNILRAIRYKRSHAISASAGINITTGLLSASK